MTPLLSQIVRLTKSIILQPADTSRRPSAQFIAGKHGPFGGLSGIGLSWWYSNDTHQAIESVARFTIASSADFRDCDIETVTAIVTNTLQEVCLDQVLFDGNAVLFARRENLFDCRIVSVPQLADAIREAIASNLKACIGRRCTVYAVPRFQSASFTLEGGAIRLIAKSDRDAWQKLIDDGYFFDGWSPLRPQVGLRETRTFAPPRDFECVFVAEEFGTQQGTRFNSILRFRKLAAVLHAVVCKRSAYPIYKAMAVPLEFCIQFPHSSISAGQITRSDCSPVIPYFASDIQLSPQDIESICNWYDAVNRCDGPHQNRIEKAAHFLNRGLNSDDIEAYINYFVTLDALFGQRGSVEASILEGVRSLGLDASLVAKAPWLFDLRNEIVHGGSRYISEWPKYNRYVQHFRSKPMNDVRDLAQLAVLRAPRLYS